MIKGVLEDLVPEEHTAIRVQVEAKILDKVIKWMGYHKDDPEVQKKRV